MRPDGQQIVAVLAISRGVAVLNPRGEGYDYGLIPPLEKLSLNEADYLWGSSANQSQPSRGRTYKLIDLSGREFFIDLVGRGNHIDNYRIRGELLNAPCWSVVDPSKAP